MPNRTEAQMGRIRYEGDLLVPSEREKVEARILKKHGKKLGVTKPQEYRIGGSILGNTSEKNTDNQDNISKPIAE